MSQPKLPENVMKRIEREAEAAWQKLLADGEQWLFGDVYEAAAKSEAERAQKLVEALKVLHEKWNEHGCEISVSTCQICRLYELVRPDEALDAYFKDEV